MFKSIVSCALPAPSDVVEPAAGQTTSGFVGAVGRYPTHPISSTADFMHRLQLMARFRGKITRTHHARERSVMLMTNLSSFCSSA